ncbi:hypothetical protein CPB84DRAFT_1774445 [Gymnopilus junonius]|uniref:Uncharacterized protein n=1 Tax=Gymnopilus junonius TaxID=109634 RepID=A0A9P5TPI1_GYMJU|nr:hypothetical protein CPB84DRAFT_1774445 [Gymnopilus junonius]
MSNIQSKVCVSGTNSPPLEATGEDKPMGLASVTNPSINAGHVSDSEQRKGYFPESFAKDDKREEKKGESMAMEMEKAG